MASDKRVGVVEILGGLLRPVEGSSRYWDEGTSRGGGFRITSK